MHEGRRSIRPLLASLVLAVGARQAILAQAEDRDGDGRIDFVQIGDWDGNGRLEDADIMGGLLALADDVSTAQLVAGVFELDPDNDGRGENYGLTCDNWNDPHVCIPRSGITLRGMGPGLTILRKGQTTPGADYGDRQLIGLAVDGTTYAQSTIRISGIHVQNLGLETVGACDPVGTNAKGLRFMDCDHCSAVNIACKHLNQSCIDFARCTDSESASISAEYVGNYDADGAGSGCVPGASQPALYLYTSDGFITEHTGHHDARLTHVGGMGVNLRSDGTETRPVPWGADDYSFRSTQRQIAQTVTADTVAVPRFTGIAVPLKKTGPATGEITVEIHAAASGVPTNAVVEGYAASDFTDHDAAELTEEYALVLFTHRLADGYPERLAGGAEYAVVISFSNAVAQPNLVHVQGDLETASDTFAGGDVATNNGSAWSRKLRRDLNFSFFNGFHRDVAVSRITAEDVSGGGDRYGTCLNIAKTVTGRFREISCWNAGVIEYGNNGVNIDAVLEEFSSTTTVSRSGGGWESGLVMSPFGGAQRARNGRITAAPEDCVLVLPGSEHQTLSGLTLSHCGRHGVAIQDGRGVVLESLHIDSAGGDGVSISGSEAAVAITGSTIADSAGSGVALWAANALLDGVQLIGNETGASFDDGAGGWITRSTIAANQGAGVMTDSSSHPVLGLQSPTTEVERGENSFLCNDESVVNYGSTSIQARRNWWGAVPPPADTVGPVNRAQYLSAPVEEVLRGLLLASADGKRDVVLCWEDAAPCLGYRVFRSAQAGGGFQPLSGPQTGTCFTDAGAGTAPGDSYYRVEVD